MATNWPPAYMHSLTDWINRGSPKDNSLYGMWDAPDPAISASGSQQPGEGGVDLGVSVGTPVYALATGPILTNGYASPGDTAHGVITQRVNVPGAGIQDLYYQHIQPDLSIKPGTVVQKGQRIGTIGPFNEIEMGFNPAWGGVWGGQWGSPGNANPTANHPGPWVRDPRLWLAALMTGNPSPVSASGTSSTSPLDPIGSFWSLASPTLIQWGEYIAIFLIAIVLVLVGFFLLSGETPAGLARKVV